MKTTGSKKRKKKKITISSETKNKRGETVFLWSRGKYGDCGGLICVKGKVREGVDRRVKARDIPGDANRSAPTGTLRLELTPSNPMALTRLRSEVAKKQGSRSAY